MRFLISLVEVKVLLKITLFFSLKGHAKKKSTRVFNLVKKGRHIRNMHAYDKLSSVINERYCIDVARISKDDFYYLIE